MADDSGGTPPLFASAFEVELRSTASNRAIAECCNRIVESTDVICQPSEPLDERWRNGWAGILEDVRQLKSLLGTK